MSVPYTFGSATSAIPLSQLDSNFATTITLGNTAIQLGNTVTTLNNMTLANVTISGGSGNLTTLGNATLALGGTTSTVGNLTLSNVTISSVASTFPNNYLGNSTATLGNATITLGGTTSTVGNLTVTNTTVTNYTETPYSANSSTAITISLANGTVQIITLTGNATITMPTAVSGKSFIMYLRQDATGSRTVTWSTVNWAGGTTPTVTSTASKQDIYSFFSDGTSWYGVTVGQNYTQ